MKKIYLQFIVLSLVLFGSGIPSSVYAQVDDSTASEVLDASPNVQIVVSQKDDTTVITFDSSTSTCKITVDETKQSVPVVQSAPELNLNFPASCLDISINSGIKSLSSIAVLPSSDSNVQITVKSEPLTMDGPVIVPSQQASDGIQPQSDTDIPVRLEAPVTETQHEIEVRGNVLNHEVKLSFLQVYRC